MTFTRKRNPIIFNYTIDGETIKRVEENMDLGVLFDKGLTLQSPFEYMTNQANTTSKSVKRQSQFFGQDTIKIITFKVHRNSIESIQKQMVLFLLGDDK